MTNNRHKLSLPDGKTIEIFIDARGFAVQCQAICDNRVIFDSFDRKSTMQQSFSRPKEDARRSAAKMLLQEMQQSDNPKVVQSSKELFAITEKSFA